MTIQHLIFVRHGESEHLVNNLTGGWTDTSLTAKGRGQIEAAASALSALGLDEVSLFCSDSKRSAESAAIIGAHLGCNLLALASLRENNNGDGANLTHEAAAKIAAPLPPVLDLDWRPYPNAETWREMSERMRDALKQLEAMHRGSVIVVGHAISGHALVVAWLGLPIDSHVAFQFEHASITEFRVNRWGEREVVRANVPPALMA